MASKVLNQDSYPSLTERATAVVANARTEFANLKRREKNLVFWLWLFGIVMLLAMLVDIGIGVTFNTALITNMREDLTWWDQFVRGVAAFAMVGTLMGVVAGVHATFNSHVETPKRVLAFLVTSIIAVAIFMVASAIGYANLATILGKLWSGASAGAQVALDPITQGVAAEDPPFLLRLASSALFLGVGFLAALAEVAWLMVRNRIDPVRELLAQYGVILERNARYESNRDDYLKKIEDKTTVLDPEYRHALGHGAVLQKIQSYRDAVETARPSPINPAHVDKAVWARHQQDTEKVNRFLKSAEGLAANTSKHLELVNQFFKKPPSTQQSNPTV